MKFSAIGSLLIFTSLLHAQQVPTKLSLDAAIEIAKKQSPVFLVAKSGFEAAVATKGIALSERNPKLSLNGFATNGTNSSIVPGSPFSDPAASMFVPPGGFWDGNLMLMVPLLAPQLWEMVSTANWQVRAAKGKLSEAEAELAYSVTEGFYRIQFLEQEVLAIQKQVEATEELLRTTEARVESGAAIAASADRVRAELSRSQRELTTARNEVKKAQLTFKQILGLPLSQELDLESKALTSVSALDQNALILLAKKQRGKLESARAMLAASSSELRSAKSQSVPKVYAFGMGDSTNRNDMGGVTYGVTLSVPLYDGGKIRSEVARAAAMKAQSTAMVADAELTVEREVREAILDVESSQANAESAQNSLASAVSTLEVVSLRVLAGKSILLEQLDALAVVRRAKSDQSQAEFELKISMARLDKAIGGKR